MGAAEPQDPNMDGRRTTPAPAPILLQLVASAAGTVVGQALGPSFAGKLVAGLVGAAAGAFLTAPGTHHRRRIVAVALFVALLAMLRRTSDAQASDKPGHGAAGRAWEPANWAAVALTAVAGFAVGSGVTTLRGGWDDGSSEARVTVPEVRGEPRAAAFEILDGAGLQPLSSDEPSESIAMGLATRTDPRAGVSVDEGAAVRVYVSSGSPPAELRIPDVRGLPRAEALRVLSDTGLTPTSRQQPSESLAAGLATGTDPPAATRVELAAEVTLFVSSGPAGPELTVPDVSGRPEAQAIATLESVGLRPSSTAEASSTVPEGVVIRTAPGPGTPVEESAEINVVVSSGPPPLLVPPVAGRPRNEALDLLSGAGLVTDTSRVITETVSGIAVRTEPPEGTEVQRGDLVTLFVSCQSPCID